VNKYSIQEIEILYKFGATQSTKNLRKLLPQRNIKSIDHKLSQLKIKKVYDRFNRNIKTI